ncbi:hypothetical protein FM103_13450 [Corynebacterium xerosis]|nr:hypothetical protein FM103_13450 [Corynebacterium xerosis]
MACREGRRDGPAECMGRSCGGGDHVLSHLFRLSSRCPARRRTRAVREGAAGPSWMF